MLRRKAKLNALQNVDFVFSYLNSVFVKLKYTCTKVYTCIYRNEIYICKFIVRYIFLFSLECLSDLILLFIYFRGTNPILPFSCTYEICKNNPNFEDYNASKRYLLCNNPVFAYISHIKEINIYYFKS